jgi:ATP-dependent exoDNAse (exonuclease V) beta subunit
MFNFVGTPVPLVELESVEIDGKRFYPTPGGEKYPSVTTVTSVRSIKKIMEWRKRVGEEEANRVSERATRRGTSLHAIIEAYLQNQELSDEEILPTILFKVCKGTLNRINNIHALEAPLYSDYLRLAGRVDCIAEFDGILSIIDFKTSGKLKKEEWIENYFVQETAYAAMYYERTGVKVDQLVTIIATESGECQVFIKKDLDTYFSLLKEYIQEFEGRVNGLF